MLPLLPDQSGAVQLGEVKRQRGIGHSKRVGDCSGGHALLARLHEQSEQRQPMLLRQRAKRLDRRLCLDPTLLISMRLEMTDWLGSVKDILNIIEMRTSYSSERLVDSRSRSYPRTSGNGGSQPSRRTVQSS